jgi:hypothetical protein
MRRRHHLNQRLYKSEKAGLELFQRGLVITDGSRLAGRGTASAPRRSGQGREAETHKPLLQPVHEQVLPGPEQRGEIGPEEVLAVTRPIASGIPRPTLRNASGPTPGFSRSSPWDEC